MSNDMITGVIHTDDKPVVFSVKQNGFDFCFMTESVYEIGKKNHPVTIVPSDGFIYGKTHNDYPIAIFVGNTIFEIFGSRNLITSAYVKDCANIENHSLSEFTAIQFSGGTLNQVFLANGVKLDYEGAKIILSHNDDSIEYNVVTDKGIIKIVICSSIKEHHGVDGFSLVNDNVVLKLEFDKPQPLRALFDHYNRMLDLLSFLTFRNNVGFDSVELLCMHPELHEMTTTANVFIRNEEKRTNKDIFYNITFDDLGDALPELVKQIYGNKEKGTSISLGFYSKNDNDQRMTNEKIRAICSALERELYFHPELKANEQIELDEMIAAVRETIKEYRNNHDNLSNDTYNTIFSSISYWSFPLGERLCAFYHKYITEICTLNRSNVTITDELIRGFVKYRNDITHGRHRILDLPTAVTAYYLGGLVYCSVLERIGLSREKIHELCVNKVLS